MIIKYSYYYKFWNSFTTVTLLTKEIGIGLRVKEVTKLYRAVTPEELADLLKIGRFRNPFGIEHKYFSQTEAGARQYAKMAETAFGDAPYSIVASSIPTQEITPSMIVEVDRGIPAVLVPTAKLRKLSSPSLLE